MIATAHTHPAGHWCADPLGGICRGEEVRNGDDFARWFDRYGDQYGDLEEARRDFEIYLSERALLVEVMGR